MPRYRLAPPQSFQAVAPALDEQQRRVVDHPGGPLLVLAGPGSGKTTTLVEAVVNRIDERSVSPDRVLALTFGRKAAEHLRDQITARLGRTLTGSPCSTFHSFAYALVRAYAPAQLYAAPLRLLSAPEQDVILRELLSDHPESVRWPASLQRALGTRGFAREVQGVLSRAREKGLDAEGLHRLGVDNDIPEFVAAGLFCEQYLATLDQNSATDYADLIRRATIEAHVHRTELSRRYEYVFVDEYQDTDPGQVALLQALCGDGGNLVVVGDPHQSIYGFRGAEVRGILDFPAQFPQRDGTAAEVVVLRNIRRFGPRILTATQRVSARLGLPGSISPQARAEFAAPTPVEDKAGRVDVLTFATERAEAEHLADLLRRAHLEDGIAWDEMAVLVRSGRASIPGLRRSLTAAGVPVEVASDDAPLVADPAVAPLLAALEAVLNLDNADAATVGYIASTRAEELLLGPLSGLDAGGLRRLARALRARDKSDPDREPRSSGELLRQALVTPGFLDGLDGDEAAAARGLHQLLHRARALTDEGASAEGVLWALWSGTRWPRRLFDAAESVGAASRRAHRDLDSLIALFEAAARAQEQRDHLGVRNFLASLSAQQIPADTLAERGVRGAAVRLLTAHRSKGLQWRLTVVAHVQAEAWPDLRRRNTLLRADRIGAGEVVPPTTTAELLAEERRLFYVACTRARERLVVTAVASADDEGEQPSPFIDELGVDRVVIKERPRRPMSMPGMVAELRRTAADPESAPPLRAAAARRLRRLAAEQTRHGRPLVGMADPTTWWGMYDPSQSEQSLVRPDEPIYMSASTLEGLTSCGLRWFFEREAGGSQPAHQAASLGQILHALAERVASGELVAGPDDVDVLMAEVDLVWERLEFRTPWSRQREYDRVRSAVARFLKWHHSNPRSLIGTELKFAVPVEIEHAGAMEQVLLNGYADRIELNSDGAAVVVDLKTGRTSPTNVSVKSNLQLALYQYAIDQGALDTLGHPGLSAGGAELVQLGLDDPSPSAKVQPQDAQPDGTDGRNGLREQIGAAATMLRTESFPAVPGAYCKHCVFIAMCPAKSAGSVISQ